MLRHLLILLLPVLLLLGSSCTDSRSRADIRRAEAPCECTMQA